MNNRIGGLAGALLGGSMLLTACATPAASPASDIAAIDQLRQNFTEAVAAEDYAALGMLSHPDFTQVMPGGPDHLEMYAATEGPLPPGYRLDITPIELVVINDEWAYEYGTTLVSYNPRDATDPVTIPNTYLLLLRKHEGAWKPFREVASAMPPPDGWPAKE